MTDHLEIEEVHLIDDSCDEIRITELILRKDRVAARFVAHGTFPTFLDHLRTQNPDNLASWLVAVDLNMGAASGIDAIRELREEPVGKQLIAGICTGSDDPQDQCDALDAGASFFVTKPLRASALHKICQSVSALTYIQEPDDSVHILRAAN